MCSLPPHRALPRALRVLRVDLNIDCNGEAHKALQIYAYVMILVYPIGVPLTYAYILYVRFGSQMRMMRTVATLRSKLRVVALQKLLLERHKSAQDARANGNNAVPAVKLPTEEEIPGDVRNEIRRLEQQQERVHRSLPDFVKKLVEGYRMEMFWFEIFEYAAPHMEDAL